MSVPLIRVWRPGRPVPVRRIVGQQRRGGGDPTQRVVGDTIWRGARTPHGPVGLALTPQGDAVEARAWGSGAAWALDQLPDLLGDRDDWSGFDPRHPVLVEARRRHPHLRLGRTGLVFEALMPSIIEQKVTGQEAFAGYAALVRRHGDPAPGPGAELGLRVAPAPQTVAAIPSWAWLQLHIDPARSSALVRVAQRGVAWERFADGPATELDRALRSMRGVGAWTSAEVRARALGDPDAVSFGDYHVARDVGWALAGEEFDDRRMADFLEPWRPQRGRVPFLIAVAGLHRPRRGPRMSPRTHLPTHDPRRNPSA